MHDTVYFNGHFVPLADANISIKNHSFLYGTSLFEGIRGYYNAEKKSISIFRMKEHYQRVLANSKIFFMTPGATLDELMDLTTELVRRNAPQHDFYIRFTLYKSGESIGPYLEKLDTDFCIWTSQLGNYVDIDKGLHVTLSAWRRLSDNAIPPCAKAGGAYMNTAIMITDAKKKGFDEVISLTESGHVSEGSAMNVFLVRDGKLITPAVTENILEGVTRNSVITLAAKELGITVEERIVSRTELYRAEEIFFTGTAAQIAPVTQIDYRPVGDGTVGKMTHAIQALYFDVAKNNYPKYKDWCTEVSVAASAASL
ncbi:MAG: branched-chain amino acid transaminase [Cyanobacteria bacterium P01_H01_bin.74]